MMELSKKASAPFGLLLLLSIFILIFAYIRWEDVVTRHPDGSYSIEDTTAEKADDRVDRIREKTELYKLVAESDGYFACPLCPPEATNHGRFFLYYGEIYKYGVSMSPRGRYTKSELAGWKLDYVVLDMGSYAEMMIQETLLMSQYPLHPENMKRPQSRRLVTPPGSGTRLR